LNVTGVQSIQKDDFETYRTEVQGIPAQAQSFHSLNSATSVLAVRSALTEWTINSFMGRVNYSFNDVFLGVHYKFMTGNFTFNPGFSVHQYNMNDEQLGTSNKQSFNRILPDVYALWQIKKSETLTYNYSLTNNFTDINKAVGEEINSQDLIDLDQKVENVIQKLYLNDSLFENKYAESSKLFSLLLTAIKSYSDSNSFIHKFNQTILSIGFHFKLKHDPQKRENEYYFAKIGSSEQIYDLSSGELFLLSLIAIVFREKNTHKSNLLILDEPDRHFDPKLIKKFFKLIYEILCIENNIQVIMSTHRPDTIALSPNSDILKVFTSS
jgi:hypothetical protein